MPSLLAIQNQVLQISCDIFSSQLISSGSCLWSGAQTKYSTNMNDLSTRNTTILFIALPVCNMYLLKCLFLPDPRDDLGGMDVARKVRYKIPHNFAFNKLYSVSFPCPSELLCIAWTAAVLSLFVSY